ncbi:hypothetical protein ACERK3_13235 [Phycisphaerales bacterium AB-hyl4]|uniref:Lipoprotein SmpA/OmlA domain-containing protein n=1 Tax=Natronomicrosphaera hydrolytica TaxID=3242702 RepID=A0ABV4U6N6_9BACT
MSRLRRWCVMSAALMLVMGLTFSGGCQSGESTASANGEAEVSASYDPQEGMTRDEIREMYRGEPDRRSVGSDGSEVWTYHVNAGEAWIPFNFGYRPRYHVIHFDAEGTVERYVRDD